MLHINYSMPTALSISCEEKQKKENENYKILAIAIKKTLN